MKDLYGREIDGIDEICLTTNGILLKDLAQDLKNAGLDRINISLDTLDKDKYKYITRIGDINDVMNGIDSALSVGFKKIKINVVLIGGFNDDERHSKLSYIDRSDSLRNMNEIGG